jgi:probable O-glycosylation ligase (exosortase A-associated)
MDGIQPALQRLFPIFQNPGGPSSRRSQILIAVVACLVVASPAFIIPHPAVMAAIGIVPLVIVFAFYNPFILCLAFICFSFFRIHEAFMVLNKLHIPQMLAVGTLTVLGLQVLFHRIKVAWTPELRLFAIFFGLVTFGCVVASGRDVAFAYWTDTFSKIALMVFAIASLAKRPQDFALASRAFVLSGMLIASLAIYNHANGLEQVEGTRVTIGRSTGSVLGDPNDLSLVLLFPLSFAVSLVLTSRTPFFGRVLGLAGAATIAVAILDTQSRGGLLGMVAVCAVFAAQRIKNKAVLIGIGVVGVMGLFAVAGISGRSSGGAAESGLVDESSEGRLRAWGAAWRMALARPLTGVGLNCYVSNYYFYQDWWEGFAKAVHSTWFAALAETGFLGFAVFITMVIRTVRSAFRSGKALSLKAAGDRYDPAVFGMAQAVMAGMAGFVVCGSFLTQAFTWPLYILFSLAVAIARYIEANDPASPPSPNAK